MVQRMPHPSNPDEERIHKAQEVVNFFPEVADAISKIKEMRKTVKGREMVQEIISDVLAVEGIRKDTLEMFFGPEKEIEVEIVEEKDEFSDILEYDTDKLLVKEGLDVVELHNMVFLTYRGKEAVNGVYRTYENWRREKRDLFK